MISEVLQFLTYADMETSLGHLTQSSLVVFGVFLVALWMNKNMTGGLLRQMSRRQMVERRSRHPDFLRRLLYDIITFHRYIHRSIFCSNRHNVSAKSYP